MHVQRVGIEHLMTGLHLLNPDGVRFVFESPSVVRIESDAPFELYCEVKQAVLRSTEELAPEQKHTTGELEWWAQSMAEAMRLHYEVFDNRKMALPDPVVRALHSKFGGKFNLECPQIQWDGGNGCWYFYKYGMYHGIEQDGYIHT